MSNFNINDKVLIKEKISNSEIINVTVSKITGLTKSGDFVTEKYTFDKDTLLANGYPKFSLAEYSTEDKDFVNMYRKKYTDFIKNFNVDLLDLRALEMFYTLFKIEEQRIKEFTKEESQNNECTTLEKPKRKRRKKVENE